MKRLFILSVLIAVCLAANAARGKDGRRLRHNVACDTRSAANRAYGFRSQDDWDASRTYGVPVVLMEFTDLSFSMETPAATYDSLFNVHGYNRGHGLGCVVDYFRDQSGGLFNLRFDIIGPVRVNDVYKKNTDSNYGASAIREALNKSISQLNNPDYDWNADGEVESVIVVYAGVGGNESDDAATGCIWPHTNSYYINNVGGLDVDNVSVCPERWTSGGLCGIGTICHEFCHCLGLPDLYPVSNSDDADYSVLDEWDLMDGGNYTDDGWCPPNMSLHEKEFLGWATPVELTATTAVSGMKTMDEGGVGYRIRPDLSSSTADEYYLLENRQHQGWDYCLPGHGLLITHIDFSASVWRSNRVNSYKNHYRLHYLNANNHSYPMDEALVPKGRQYDKNKRSFYLAGTAYPYVSDTLVNRQLTDTSIPAATLFNRNTDGTLFMGKPILDIDESPEGLISFFFASNNSEAGLPLIRRSRDSSEGHLYDLQGRAMGKRPLRPGLYIKDRRKIIIQ